VADDNDSAGFVGYLWEGIRGFFVLMWDKVWVSGLSLLPNFLDGIGKKMEESVKAVDEPIWDFMIDFLRDQKMMTPDLDAVIQKFKDLPPIWSMAMFFIIMQKQWGIYNETAAYAMSAKMRHLLNVQLKPELADVSSLIRTAMIAPEKIDEVVDRLHKWGYADSEINMLFISNYRLYDADMCRELFLRGILTSDKLFERMRELGFTDTRTKEMMQAWEIIPGPQDLFHMVAKEAFEPEMISHIGLGDEFPEEQLPWLAKQGISKFWAEKYWYAHWDQPSVQMGYEMLHRKVIDEKELDMLFKAVEMPPFWRDKLKEISYIPYTRVDIRRMYDLGIVEIEDVYKNYQDLGYDDAHALEMTKFTIAWVDPEDKKLSKGEILGAYTDKIVSEPDCFSLLRNLGYKEDQAVFYIAGAEFDAARKLEGSKLKVIKERFILRLSDKFETMRELSLLNLDAKRVDLLFEQWEIELFKDNKIPSKSDLEKFWLNNVINDDEWHEEMDKIGYKGKYRNWYFVLMEAKRKGK